MIDIFRSFSGQPVQVWRTCDAFTRAGMASPCCINQL
jgi:hypothetical protein